MNFLYTLLAFFVGIMLPIQVGINAELARFINSPLLAALISFATGAVCLGLSVMIMKVPFPTFNQISIMPAWAWGVA